MAEAPTVYILYGGDELSLSEFLRDRLILKLGDRSTADLNLTRFDGPSVTMGDLRATCGAMPFLAARRLVIVKDYLGLLAKRAGGKREAEALVELFAELPPTTALVFADYEDIPRNSPVLKWAEAAGASAYVKHFPLPKSGALPGWIVQRARAKGGEFTPRAAQALAAAVSEPLRLVDSEILKLLTYVNFERAVETADVERVTSYAGQANVFEMVDALGLGDGSKALEELHKLLQGKDAVEGYFGVFGMIVRQFRLLLQTRELMDAGAREDEVAAALGLHSYPAGKIYRQARNFTLPALEAIYRKLLEVDEQYKTGEVEGPVALDMLVAELTAGSRFEASRMASGRSHGSWRGGG